VNKGPTVLLVVSAILVVSCLVLGVVAFGVWRLADVAVEPAPARTVVQPGFTGPLEGTWRALRGGFTGVEASVPSDDALGEKWPPGSVVELVLSPGARYRFTFVEATGSGVHATKTLVREEGVWAQQGDTLTLTAESGVRVTRAGGDRRSTPLAPGARTYRLATRIEEWDEPAPAAQKRLRLVGPCPHAPDAVCEWDLERD
jgi:hypothetical protein